MRNALGEALVVMLVLLAGCSPTPVNNSLSEKLAQLQAGSGVGSFENRAWPEPAIVNHFQSHEPNIPADSFNESLSFVHPFLLSATTSGSTLPTTVPGDRGENLFSLDYVRRVETDIKDTFTAPAYWQGADWLVAGGVAAGVGVAFVFDQDIQKAVQRNRTSTTDHIFNAIEPFGQEYSIGVLAAFYLGGELFQDRTAKSVALDGISASIISSALIVQPLKFTAGRKRPSAGRGDAHFRPFGGSYSFPSGHATQAFAVATVIAEHYDSPWIKIASYGLASAVGFARVNHNAHWTSDVLAGAAIGTFVGEVVVHGHHEFALSPMVSSDSVGLQMNWSY